LGLFIEFDSELCDKNDNANKLHSYLKETNESYKLATAKSDNSIPISIYFVKTDSFMGFNELKAEKIGIGIRDPNRLKTRIFETLKYSIQN